MSDLEKFFKKCEDDYYELSVEINYENSKKLLAICKLQREALKTYGNIASWGSGACTNVLVRNMSKSADGWEIAKKAIKKSNSIASEKGKL